MTLALPPAACTRVGQGDCLVLSMLTCYPYGPPPHHWMVGQQKGVGNHDNKPGREDSTLGRRGRGMPRKGP